MSYFSERRKANNVARMSAIEARKGVSPFAEYDGGKYEMMQYEGYEEKTGYFRCVEQAKETASNADSSVSSANISSAKRG